MINKHSYMPYTLITQILGSAVRGYDSVGSGVALESMEFELFLGTETNI